MKVLVLGGGVIGITTAWFLAREGHEVSVVEREQGVALGTSYANGALIHTCLVEPWNEPGIALKLLQWIGRADAPAMLRLGALPGMLGWGMAFLRTATSARHGRHTLVNLRLALLSAKTLKEVRRETGIEHDQREQSILKILREPAALDAGVAHAKMLAAEGEVPFRVLDRAAVVDETLKIGLVPLGARLRLAGSAEFAGADLSLNRHRSDYVWQTALKVYPALGRHVEPGALERWTGLRPMTPDGPPILGPTRYRNLLLNTGHGHLGWTFACGSAQVIAALLAGRQPPIALDGLTLDRF